MTDKAQPRRKRNSSHPEHPDLDRFLASIAGALEPAAARAFTSHTSRCASCRERLHTMTLLVQAAAVGSLEPVPDDLRREAEGIFSVWRARELGPWPRVTRTSLRRPKSPWGALRMRAAPLSTALSFAAGFRTVSTQQPRLELEGGGCRIELECLPSGRLCTLRGRLIREREDADLHPEVKLEFEGSRLQPVLTGPRGFFGPITAPCSRLRIVLATARRAYRSRWLDLT